MGIFFEKNFTPLVHIQNDQCVMGIILRYVCWGTHRPPPRGARQLTARPADPQGLGQPRVGGGITPLTTPKTVAHPSGSHIGWRRPPWTGTRFP